MNCIVILIEIKFWVWKHESCGNGKSVHVYHMNFKSLKYGLHHIMEYLIAQTGIIKTSQHMVTVWSITLWLGLQPCNLGSGTLIYKLCRWKHESIACIVHCLDGIIIDFFFFFFIILASRHVKSSIVSGVLQSTWRAIQNGGRYQGDMTQQGGQFIVGPGMCYDVYFFSRMIEIHWLGRRLCCLNRG